MATTTTKSHHAFNLLDAIYSALASVGHALMRPADAKAENARRQINHLQSLSDAELSARGIRREDIEYRVFSGSYYA